METKSNDLTFICDGCLVQFPRNQRILFTSESDAVRLGYYVKGEFCSDDCADYLFCLCAVVYHHGRLSDPS